MHLLLLPVVLATFPLWLGFSRYMSPARRRTLGAAVLVFAVFVLIGYVTPLTWTGFRGQTLWSWLIPDHPPPEHRHRPNVAAERP